MIINMSKPSIEIETKFIIPNQAMLAELQTLRHLAEFVIQPTSQKANCDQYLDTADKAIRQAGYACRIRQMGQAKQLTLKSLTLAEGQVHRRQEFEIEIVSENRADWPDSEAKSLLLGIIGQAELVELFSLRQHRSKFHVMGQNSGPLLELSLDEVFITQSAEPDYLELEAELLEAGTEQDLARFVEALLEGYALEPEARSKFERALTIT